MHSRRQKALGAKDEWMSAIDAPSNSTRHLTRLPAAAGRRNQTIFSMLLMFHMTVAYTQQLLQSMFDFL